ncbi:RrF2 family transcriptional regulator [Neobacillus thermocopriae]|uniref:Rrf2 family transcriptional regulator n=1 Tax=Neobacillus thermocopriae TaxID=1215031 RepID=A0A6B3TNL9_9BACI|nr:Rrf2 family transcriptional regulator [Neobacillus thermocopriae]MED3625110.1 Rrf2 family transcriptional regulator [Neobacillus thermocopriae]MED3714751.1 Rrf2 family transcriptional regulator [Neobacillus thermocopriae]NEX77966.1 Rrf2 family transcriptional regulator [Neobacillus thermocopriae]
MKVSSKGEYALRALILLGNSQGSVLSIQEISDKTLVSIHYLEQILLQLKKMGYVTSKRGVKGGYMLHKKAAEIHLGEVIRDLEGPLSPMACASITKYEPCPLEEGCQLKPLWSLIRDTIAYVLERTTLEDLLENRILLQKGEDFVVVKRTS